MIEFLILQIEILTLNQEKFTIHCIFEIGTTFDFISIGFFGGISQPRTTELLIILLGKTEKSEIKNLELIIQRT